MTSKYQRYDQNLSERLQSIFLLESTTLEPFVSNFKVTTVFADQFNEDEEDESTQKSKILMKDRANESVESYETTE